MFQFFAVIPFGFMDAFNPCALATAALFVVLIAFLCKDFRALMSLAGTFMAIHFLARMFFHIGYMNAYFLSLEYTILVICLYEFLALVFVLTGLLLSLYWLRSFKGNKIWLPSGVYSGWNSFLKIVGLGIGVLLAIGSNFWPSSTPVLLVEQQALFPKKLLLIVSSLSAYEVTRLWPIIFISFIFYRLRAGEMAEKIKSKQSLIFSISAAFYLALGMGLFCLFYPKIF